MGNTIEKEEFTLEWFINHIDVETLAADERKCFFLK